MKEYKNISIEEKAFLHTKENVAKLGKRLKKVITYSEYLMMIDIKKLNNY